MNTKFPNRSSKEKKIKTSDKGQETDLVHFILASSRRKIEWDRGNI